MCTSLTWWQFAATRSPDWLEFYRNNALWHVRYAARAYGDGLTEAARSVVTVFRSRGGCSLSGNFTVSVLPSATVASFLAAVARHPDNRQHSAHLQPHDPAKLGRHNAQYVIVPTQPDTKPNNAFDPSILDRTVKDAGLCNGAVLEQPESMCD